MNTDRAADFTRRGFLGAAAATLGAGATAWDATCLRADDDAIGANSFDVVVLGGTPGGLAAAVSAAVLGHSVALVESHKHFGGMSASGLGKSDIEHRELIRGFFGSFVDRVRIHYLKQYGRDSENVKLCRGGYFYEPSVAERMFHSFIDAPQPTLNGPKPIALLPHHRLAGVEVRNNRVISIRVIDRETERERRLTGRVFIDATYGGDLYARAGAEFRVGREARDEFGEPHAGHVYLDYNTHQFLPRGTGAGDKRLTAYTYRLCLTDNPDNAAPLKSPPPGYDRKRYLGYLEDYATGRFGKDYTAVRIALSIARIPNRKFDVNMNPRSLGFVFVEENAGYIEADWKERENICERIRNLTLGLLWFLQNDPDMPSLHRDYARTLHLPLDEFADNGHFPFQLYVREARRLAGEYTLTEHDVALVPGSKRTGRHDDAIAVGEFPIDSFPVQKRQPGDTVVLEGYLGMLREITRPYQIPYRIMIPRKIDGLIVPVAASTTHVAYSTIRMEPTWMALGQAAGAAAHVAISGNIEPRAVPIGKVQMLLRATSQVIDLPETPRG